jgi:Spy/CpxP family protein refolding chaperone
MKTIKMLSFIVILTIGFSLIGDGQADAKGSGKKTHRHWKKKSTSWDSKMMMSGIPEQLAAELKLTTEQKQEIAAIVAKYRVASQEKRDTSRKARSEFMQKILTENLDEAAIRAEYQKIAAEKEKLREERFVERVKMLSEIKAVLTEEQIKVWQGKNADWFQNTRWDYKNKKYGGKKKYGHGGYRK